MVEITINNSYSKVTGMTPVQDKELRELLSFIVNPEAAFFSRFGVRKRSLLDKKGNFPTGLIKKVWAYFNASGVTPSLKASCAPPAGIQNWPELNLGSIVPYPDQVVVANRACKEHRMGVVMPTGSGKSLTMALLIDRLKVRTLVVVPNLEIKKQLERTFSSLFGDTDLIRVENIDSKSLKTLTDFDCLIIDEAHHVAASTYQKLNKTAWTGIYYRFFFTATFFRNSSNEYLLFEGIAGAVSYQLTYKDSVSKGYIVPVESYYMTVPKVTTDAYTWAEVYSELVVCNKVRNNIIKGLLGSLLAEGCPTLCLVKEIAHGAILSGLTGIPFINGQDETTRGLIEDFNSGRIKSLIGTIGVLGEGVDTKPCEYVILAGLGKAKSSIMQQIGRAVRVHNQKTSAKVIIFKDESHKFTLKHFRAQAKILKDEYGSKPTQIK